MAEQDEKEVRHTPTPWRFTDVGVVYWREDGRFGRTITICVTGKHPSNAEFITRACNSHDKLVDALERLRSRFKALLEQHPVRDVAETLAEVGAALNSAKG